MANIRHMHGLSSSPLYRIWYNMIQRCHNPKDKDFRNYGGRGITVCDEWRTSLQAFIRDIGPRPSLGHTVERIDNMAGYRSGNVRWAMWWEQARNRRNTHPAMAVLNLPGALTAYAQNLGMKAGTLYSRARMGWSPERILSTPAGPNGKTASNGICGVSRSYGRFRARVRMDGQIHNLGTFDTPEHAAAVVVEFRKKLDPQTQGDDEWSFRKT